MPFTAKLSYLHIAPRKVRLVADLIRGKSVEKAQSILKFTQKRAAESVLKLLNSAVANAKNQFQLSEADLYIGKITVDEGPKLKRFMPRSRGQAYEIQKKVSHINLVLEKKDGHAEKIVAAQKESSKAAVLAPKAPRPKFKTQSGNRPKIEKSAKRIFRRKAF